MCPQGIWTMREWWALENSCSLWGWYMLELSAWEVIVSSAVYLCVVCWLPIAWSVYVSLVFMGTDDLCIWHNVHQDRKCYQQFNKKLTHNVNINKGSSITVKDAHTHTHTHTHTNQPACTHTHNPPPPPTHTHTHTHIYILDRGEGQCCLTEIFWEEKCLVLYDIYIRIDWQCWCAGQVWAV